MNTRRRTYSGISNNERGFRYVSTDKGIIDFDLIEDCLDTGKLPIISGTENDYNNLMNSVNLNTAGKLVSFLSYSVSNYIFEIRLPLQISQSSDMANYKTLLFKNPVYYVNTNKNLTVGDTIDFYRSDEDYPISIIHNLEDGISTKIPISFVTNNGRFFTFICNNYPFFEYSKLVEIDIDGVILKEVFKVTDKSNFSSDPFNRFYEDNRFGFFLPISENLILISDYPNESSDTNALTSVIDIDNKKYWNFDTKIKKFNCIF